jgi:hypothetical protein
MKKIAAAALVLCLLGGTSALAQNDDHHDHNAPAKGAGPGGAPKALPVHPGGPAGPGGPGNNFRPGGSNRPVVPGNPGNPGNNFRPGGPNRPVIPGNPGNPGNPGGNPGYRPGNPGYRPGNPGNGNPGYRPGNNFRPGFGAPGFRPGGGRPQYNPQYFPRTFNLGNRFNWRGGNWAGPRGFYYRSWVYGQILPFGWYSSQWYINDYYDYDLPVPPYGYEWIRNGPDALLVDVNSGEVVSSVPGIFY